MSMMQHLKMETDLKSTRTICHVDLDAFYAQVEEQHHPHLRGMSIAVIQYNPFGDLKTYSEDKDRVFNDSNGSIIALSYGEARKRGVKRNMRGAEARQLCPGLQLVQVPTSNGKADLTSYRRHGAAVLAILAEPDAGVEIICEKASIDESYLDVTDAAKERLRKQRQMWAEALPADLEQVHVGYQRTDPLDEGSVEHTAQDWFSRPAASWTATDALLAHASQIVAEKRAKVHSVLGFTLSAGVAHSKLLAKLCSGLNKPNQQTVLPATSVPDLLHDLPLPKLRGLGGQLGMKVQCELGVHKIGELSQVPLSKLHNSFGEDTGSWLHNMCRGFDNDAVQPRVAPKSVGCGKSFTAHLQIMKLETAQYWIQNLSQEIHERLEEDAVEYGRRATRIVLHAATPGGHTSKGAPLPSHGASVIAKAACQLMSERAKRDKNTFPITSLSLVASSFDASAAKTANLRAMFAACQQVEEPQPKMSGLPASHHPPVPMVKDKPALVQVGCTVDPTRDRCSLACPENGCALMVSASNSPADVGHGGVLQQTIGDMLQYTCPDASGISNAGLQHEKNLPLSNGHASSALALQYEAGESVGTSAGTGLHTEVPTPPQTVQGTAASYDTQQIQVDSVTLAQMPSDIRSELFLMSASGKHGLHQTQPSVSGHSSVKHTQSRNQNVHGSTAIFGAKRRRDS